MPGDLYYGDNLDVLRHKVASESVDLVYLDPPFNSDRNYNVIHKHSQAQEQAFVDTWQWDDAADRSFAELTGHAPQGVRVPEALGKMMGTLRELLWQNHRDTLAYLSMMAIRLVEMRRVLRSTGSVFLHCDPTASHYLKVILDNIFGLENFRNEIIWRRTGAHTAPKSLGRTHDVILWFSKSAASTFSPVKRPYMRRHVEERYVDDPSTGLMKFKPWRMGNVMTGPGATKGSSGAPWRGFDPSKKNRHWAIPGFLAQQLPAEMADASVLERLDALYEKKLIEVNEGAAWPVPVRFLAPDDGDFIADIWAYQPYTEGCVQGTDAGIDADVAWLGPIAKERVGYPTQKPVGLLERIVRLASPAGGMVLDPFCGCGTTIEAAEKLGRKWIGIDVAIRAVDVIKDRLDERFQPRVWTEHGEPSDVDGAAHLAETNAYDFQWWAVRKLGGQPPKGEKKKGGDGGIDGEMMLRDFTTNIQRRVIVSVKGGHTLTPEMVKGLESTARLEKVDYGILVTMHPPTAGMRTLAREFGTVAGTAQRDGRLEHRIRIITVPEILAGTFKLPGLNITPRSQSAPPPAELRVGDNLQLPFPAHSSVKKPKPRTPGPGIRNAPAVAEKVLPVADGAKARRRKRS